MNPLQKHSNLFANGLFRIKYYESDPIPLNAVTLCRLHKKPHLRNVKLVARKIEDMTEDEEEELISKKIKRGERDVYDKSWTDYSYLTKDFIYLLSIGVYPFDQSHFKDGTVIDSRTI